MLSRRAFLRNGAVVAASSAVISPLIAGITPAAKPDLSRRALVVIELAGGNDALNTVVPVNSDIYYDQRPTLAIPPGKALMLDRHFGLHPAMGAMHDLFRRGRLAIVQGVGYPNPSRSHFRSMEIWHRASTDTTMQTGWLARGCEGMLRGLERGIARIVAIGARPAEMFRSPRIAGVGIAEEPASGAWAVKPLYLSGDDGFAASPTVAQIAQLTGIDVAAGMRNVESALAHARRPKAAYRSDSLSRGLALFAQLIVRNSGTRFFHISQSGFDNHARQAIDHARALGRVSSAMGAFLADLRAAGRDQDVLVMIFSEFGRRLRENGSAGTDHGAAGVMFFAGDAVNGGLYGQQPSLSELDDGDLRYTTDFRDAYAAVLQDWLGQDAGAMLGAGYRSLAFI